MPLSCTHRRPGPCDHRLTRSGATIAPLLVLAIVATPGRAAGIDPMTVSERFRQNHPDAIVESGGWRLRPVAELRTGFTDNVEWRPDLRTASPELTLRGSIEATREAGLAEWQISASHATTLYTSGKNRSGHDTSAAVNLTLRLSPQAELRASVGLESSRQPTIANGIEIDGTWEPYADFAAVRRLPLSLTLRASLGQQRIEVEGATNRVDYDDLVTAENTPVSQAFRSGWEHRLRTRATWSAHEALEGFLEGEFELGRYANDTADTDQFSLVAGALFEPHPLLRAEISAGYARQDYRIADGASGFVFDGQLTWYLSPLVTLTLDTAREFRGNVVTTAGGTFSTEPATGDNVALLAEWEPFRQMLVALQASWSVDETETGSRRDTYFSLSLKTQYAISDRLHAHLEIEHQDGQSSVFGDVSRNRISFGLSTPY